MIGRIEGRLLEKQPPEVLIDVNGIGYEIQMPMTSFYQLPAVGENVAVYTHFVVREDAQLLFGFADKMERGLFRELIKANGVGPKLGLTILSGMSAGQFLISVQNEDVSALVSLPGIGKKTAERLVVELKDRLAKFGKQQAVDIPFDMENKAADTIVPVNDAKEEAQSALVALGYKPVQANKLVTSVYQDGMNSENLIREALKAAI
ncbi:MAG: Holliday junction branch migration protein RuvA [Alteromonadaceae bacterium]|uniref:Holliday junction branch migration protein RuvA n=1 Tax=Alteromonas sp. 1_MG-2023 TaxID=3062669 RepID=UPI000C504E96|nr:Holliday junction branch migration protein RuvA [Alteromonas sp. 1_MG-2023]MBT82252.1 Holliday junction branch migration protein RuvA [Alteromonadaceae bacterium]MDO6477168.1 Holliday junction branch migration protein RuvA [Alteromonas sp. 1_MG-2023]MEC7692420.1 Holliday junction branch migration protein RuvA [Pseudomonadota bacterium]